MLLASLLSVAVLSLPDIMRPLLDDLPTRASASDRFSSMHQEVSYTVDGCRLHVRAVTYVEDFPTTDDSFRGLPRALVRVRPAEAGAIEAISHDVPSSELPRGGDFGTRTELTMSLGLLDASHVTVEHVRSMDVADGTVEAGIDLKWIAFPFAESDAVRAERVAEEFRRAIRLCAGAVEAR